MSEACKGRVRWKAFRAPPWKEQIDRDVFSAVWDEAPNMRQYNLITIESGKKNGKSELDTALVPNMPVNDDE
jgi:hypothetical protein